jgi:serine O-acetyltransferase
VNNLNHNILHEPDEVPLRIQSYKDYVFFLEADRLSRNEQRKKPRIIGDEIWQFQRLLRKVEYYNNCKKSMLWKLPYSLCYFIFYRLSIRLGFSIHPNCFGPGLAIIHRGTIVVSDSSRIGSNCRIHTCVNIGGKSVIGNNVYLAPGVKIFWDVHIADNIAIGANAVVDKSFPEPNITIAGVPARKISDEGSKGRICRGTELAGKKG